jgi:acyl carrier protein
VNDNELLQEFSEILSSILGNDDVTLNMQTIRADVPDWDSFNYVNFIVAVETELNIRFSVSDVESFETVGDIVNETKKLLADAV